AVTARAQTTLQVSQTQSQRPIPGVAQPQPTRTAAVPEGGEGSTLQIEPAPSAAATPAQAVAPAYQDPATAAIAAAAGHIAADICSDTGATEAIIHGSIDGGPASGVPRMLAGTSGDG